MDNSVLISNLIKRGQGQRIEFQKQVRKDSVGKSICSLINAEGGDLLLGVAANGSLHPVANATAKARELTQYLNQAISPNAPISVVATQYRQKDLIWISVWEGAQKPYSFHGKIYTRTADGTTTTADVDHLSQLIQQRKAAEFHWERQPMLGAELSDLDQAQVEETLRLFERDNPDKSFDDDPEQFLDYLGLIQNGHFTNAAVILFGKQPHRFLPQARIRLTVYQGDKDTDAFLYDRLYEGGLFQNIDQLFGYLDVLFGSRGTIAGTKRQNKSNYPVMAVREGIMNALVHRDYGSVSSTVQIAIHPNRMTIASYGRLPVGIDMADLKKEHISILRNPDIARACFIRGMVEMLGTGTLRMIRDCKANGFAEPIWKETDSGVVLEFPGLGIGEGVSEGVSEGVRDGLIAGVSEGVNIVLRNLVTLIETTPGMNSRQLAAAIGKGKSTVERYLKTLRENQLIEFRGAPKDGGYYLR